MFNFTIYLSTSYCMITDHINIMQNHTKYHSVLKSSFIYTSSRSRILYFFYSSSSSPPYSSSSSSSSSSSYSSSSSIYSGFFPKNHSFPVILISVSFFSTFFSLFLASNYFFQAVKLSIVTGVNVLNLGFSNTSSFFLL